MSRWKKSMMNFADILRYSCAGENDGIDGKEEKFQELEGHSKHR